jgi:hypothetical protein
VSLAVDIAALATPIVTGSGLWFVREQLEGSREQLKGTRTVARSEFLLLLDRHFFDFQGIALLLRDPDWKPANESEGFALARYMGFVERIERLVRDGIFDLVTVEAAYGWRIQWLVENHAAHNRLMTNPGAWREFNSLWRQLDAIRESAGRGPLCPGRAPPPSALCR